MTKIGPALAFSYAQAAFSAALRVEFARAGLGGVIDPGMGPVLFALEAHGVLTMSQLATIACVPRSTMTSIAARMKKRGLVRSAPDSQDGRGVVVALTGKGRAILPKMHGIERKLDGTFRRVLAASEVEALSKYLERLAPSFEPS